MSRQNWVWTAALIVTLASCSDDESATNTGDAATDAQTILQDAGQTDGSRADDAEVVREAGASKEAGPAGDASSAGDGGACESKPPEAPDKQSCSADDVTCFFQADTDEERQKCAELSDTGTSCLECVLLGGAACAYENGCVQEWNDLYCCHQSECGNEPFEFCAACAVEAAARQACETGVGIKCLTAGTTCFPPL